jgi:cell division septation protein DedD
VTPNHIVEPTFGPAPDPSPEAVAESRARDVSASLYMAVVGTRGQERYTRLFSAFDASGGPRMGWHWPACVSALNWLVYRSLWLWAVGALVVPALGLLLVLGVARLMFGMSGSMLAPLALTLVVAWSVVCGLFADAVYYKICNRRILLAVESSATIEEARVALATQSERRARWPAFAAADLVLVLLIGVSVAVIGGGRGPRETAAGPAEHSGPVAGKLGEALGRTSADVPAGVAASASAGATSATAASAASSAPAIAASAPSVPPSSQVAKAEGRGVAEGSVVLGPGATSGSPASPASASASAPALAPAPAPAPSPAPATSATASGKSNAVKSDHLARAMVEESSAAVASKSSSGPALKTGASSPAVPASQAITSVPGRITTPTPAPSPPGAAASARSPATPPTPPAPAASPSESAATQAKKVDKAAVTNEKKKEPPATAKASQKGDAKDVDRAPKGSGQFAVQIGIFAQEGNASKALASARSAGLPVFADTVNGDQQRVRAGPFASQAEAERAARKIKDLELPAVVVRIRKAGDAASSPAP